MPRITQLLVLTTNLARDSASLLRQPLDVPFLILIPCLQVLLCSREETKIGRYFLYIIFYTGHNVHRLIHRASDTTTTWINLKAPFVTMTFLICPSWMPARICMFGVKKKNRFNLSPMLTKICFTQVLIISPRCEEVRNT